MERIAIVTGSGRGLGSEIAEQFRDSWYVVPECTRKEMDVADPESVAAFFAGVMAAHGRIDVLVNNAAILGPVGLVEDTASADWQTAVAVNLMGAVLTTQSVLPIMRRQGDGAIINIAGGGATGPLPRRACYAASKAALVRFTECVAEEAPELRVNAVLPGPLPTDMTQDIISAGPEKLGAGEYAEHIERRFDADATARAARLCLYLAGSSLTGKTISARFDPWPFEDEAAVMKTDLYTLRRRDGA